MDAGFLQRRPGFVVDEVTLEQVFLRVLWFPLIIIIPPLLHTHLSPPHEVCDSPDQAAHYHTLSPKLGASSLIRHFASLGVKVVQFYLWFI
jgi:hypothetical protein